jgi:hypothetical protein
MPGLPPREGGGLPGRAGVTTRPAGYPSGGVHVPPAVERQLHLLTFSDPRCTTGAAAGEGRGGVERVGREQGGSTRGGGGGGGSASAEDGAENTAAVGVAQSRAAGELPWATLRARWATLRARWVTLRARWLTLRARWVTLRARWVTLRAGWVTLRARWVTLRARWVTLRARWVTLELAG